MNLLMTPEMDPIAQHRVLRLFQDHSEPSICFASFSVRMTSVSKTSKWVRNTKSSLMDLYSTMVSISFMNSRTISPSSFSTTNTYVMGSVRAKHELSKKRTSSGLTIFSIVTNRRLLKMSL